MAAPTPDVELWNSLPGGDKVVAWFGCVPHFGDAEVLSLDLARSGQSQLTVHTWMHAATEDGGGPQQRHGLVVFEFADIVELQLSDFSPQNVISSLRIRVAEVPPQFLVWPGLAKPPHLIEVTLEPCYGIHGRIRAKGLSLSVSPTDINSS